MEIYWGSVHRKPDKNPLNLFFESLNYRMCISPTNYILLLLLLLKGFLNEFPKFLNNHAGFTT